MGVIICFSNLLFDVALARVFSLVPIKSFFRTNSSDWVVLCPYALKLLVWVDVFDVPTKKFPIHSIILLLKLPAEALSLVTQDHKFQGDQ